MEGTPSKMAGHVGGVTSHESIFDREMFGQEKMMHLIPLKVRICIPARPSAFFGFSTINFWFREARYSWEYFKKMTRLRGLKVTNGMAALQILSFPPSSPAPPSFPTTEFLDECLYTKQSWERV